MGQRLLYHPGTGRRKAGVDGGRWTVDDGRWTMDDGRWTVEV
ncbi:MAG: hypothetical protein WCD37_05495 [Chloroflexia bacterium]